jgi:hypothetical protein
MVCSQSSSIFDVDNVALDCLKSDGESGLARKAGLLLIPGRTVLLCFLRFWQPSSTCLDELMLVESYTAFLG